MKRVHACSEELNLLREQREFLGRIIETLSESVGRCVSEAIIREAPGTTDQGYIAELARERAAQASSDAGSASATNDS